MKKLLAITLTIIWLYSPLYAFASEEERSHAIVVIVNKNNPNQTLTKRQLIDIYMGRFVIFPDQTKAQPVDLAMPYETKNLFYKRLVNMPLARVNAYWSRVSFTGRATPPIEQQNASAVIEYIEKNENAIGYLPSNVFKQIAAKDIKVILELYE